MSSIAARIAYRGRTQPQYLTQVQAIPAPILGWNARDALGDMDPRFAVVMDNYFPDGSRVRLRGGNVDHVTGIVGPVETLHFASFGSQRKLIAFANNSSYDVTASGAVGAPLATGFTNNRWIGVNAGASGGERALYTNGVDPAQSYDGTTWAAAGFTGPAKPTGITVAHKRVWVVDAGTGAAWFSPPEAVTGALSKFDIGSVHPSGGELVAISSLTIDGGNGPDDATVFVMKSGAIIVYFGTDPSDAANWALRGVWKAGNPIGERCLVPFDKDVILISDVGFQSLLSFTTGGGVAGVPISDNIRNAVSDASLQFENNFGWDGIYVPHRRQLVFNVPILTGSDSQQFVMNSITGAWCRYTGLQQICQAEFDLDRFIGSVGKVIKADTGGVDGTEPIRGTVQSAWNYFGLRGREKHFKQYRVHVRSDVALSLELGMGVDFDDPVLQATESSGGEEGGEWDVAEWDVASWGGGLTSTRDWRGAAINGYNGSVTVKTATSAAEVELLATDVVFDIGGII